MTTRIFVAFFIALSFSACKRYTCECTAHAGAVPEPAGKTTFTVKRNQKESVCTAKSTQPDNAGNYTTCIIK